MVHGGTRFLFSPDTRDLSWKYKNYERPSSPFRVYSIPRFLLMRYVLVYEKKRKIEPRYRTL